MKFMIYGLMVTLIVCNACKVSKNKTNTPIVNMTTPPPKIIKLEPLIPKKTMEAINTKQLNFTTFSSKLDLDIDLNGSGYSSTATLNIEKDKIIWLSITPMFGMELARAKITPEGVEVLNRWNKTYLKRPLSWLRNYIGMEVEFSVLQDLLIGNYFELAPEQPYSIVPNQANKIGSRYLVDATNTALQHDFIIENDKPKQLNLKSPTDALKIDYVKFQTLEQQQIPQDLSLDVTGRQRVTAKINFSKVKLNEAIKTEFEIPEKYKVVE